MAVSMALFCVQIDYFAANLALPRMASDLHSTPADLQWVISVYMLNRISRIAGAWGRADLPGFGELAANALPGVRASHAIGLAYGIAELGNAAGPLIRVLLTDTVGWR
ncbi:MAG: hypothetical protein ACXWD8_11095 [Mycobacterium sp.]